MAHEKIKDCVPDIDGAVAYLKKLGYRQFYLAGASTGANKICVYNFYKPRNDFKKYILICGADDTGIYYDQLGKTKFWRLLAEAKKRLKTKHRAETMPELLPEHLFSPVGFYDIANPDGDYNTFPFLESLRQIKLTTKKPFRYFKSIKKPTLAVYGDRDEHCWNSVPQLVEILKSHQPRFAYRIIKNADHGFKNHEAELANVMTNWLETEK